MKIALLARNPHLYSHRRICEAARERGHEIEVINTLRVSINNTSRTEVTTRRPTAVRPRWTTKSTAVEISWAIHSGV